jgi:hypothetical protein
MCYEQQRDVRCVQRSVFTVFFQDVVQIPANPRQCLLCGLLAVRRATIDLTVRDVAHALEWKVAMVEIRSKMSKWKVEQ